MAGSSHFEMINNGVFIELGGQRIYQKYGRKSSSLTILDLKMIRFLNALSMLDFIHFN